MLALREVTGPLYKLFALNILFLVIINNVLVLFADYLHENYTVR